MEARSFSPFAGLSSRRTVSRPMRVLRELLERQHAMLALTLRGRFGNVPHPCAWSAGSARPRGGPFDRLSNPIFIARHA